jgi:glucokinase
MTQLFKGHVAGDASTSVVREARTQRTTGKLLATQGYVVGIEISGSGSRQSVALADLNGTILRQERRPLEYVPDTQTVLRLLDEMLDEVTNPQQLQDGRILRVGVAVGGLVDTVSGIVQRLHHAHGWDNFPLQDYLADKLDTPCIIDNNANAAALAEVCHGAGSTGIGETPHMSERVVVYVGLGRGIGGGLVLDGKICHGGTGMAGEIGHMLVKEHGPKCSCGGFGHLEAIASTRAITSAMIGLSADYPETEAAIRRVTEGRPERITAEQVLHLATAGDYIAQRIVEEVQHYLGIALANIVQLLNPGMIILGGQVTSAGDMLIAPLQARIQELCLPELAQTVRVVRGSLGAEANIIGAVTLALQDIQG